MSQSTGLHTLLSTEEDLDAEIRTALDHLDRMEVMLRNGESKILPLIEWGTQTMSFVRPGYGTASIGIEPNGCVVGLKRPGEQMRSEIIRTAVIRSDDGGVIHDPLTIITTISSALRAERTRASDMLRKDAETMMRNASIRASADSGSIDPVEVRLVHRTIMGPPAHSMKIMEEWLSFRPHRHDLDLMEGMHEGVITLRRQGRCIMLEPLTLTGRYAPDGLVGLMRDLSSMEKDRE